MSQNKDILIWVIVGLFVILVLGLFEFSGFGGYRMMGGSYGVGGQAFSGIIGALIIVALVFFIIWIVKQIEAK